MDLYYDDKSDFIYLALLGVYLIGYYALVYTGKFDFLKDMRLRITLFANFFVMILMIRDGPMMHEPVTQIVVGGVMLQSLLYVSIGAWGNIKLQYGKLTVEGAPKHNKIDGNLETDKESQNSNQE